MVAIDDLRLWQSKTNRYQIYLSFSINFPYTKGQFTILDFSMGFRQGWKNGREESRIKRLPSEQRHAATARLQSDKQARIRGNEAIIVALPSRGEKLLRDNTGSDEEILVKLQGSFGEGLVVTSKRLYVIKWGYMAGQIFGGKCIAYEYRNITALEIKKHLVNRTFQVLTPATQDNNKLSFWNSKGGKDDAIKSDNAVTFGLNQDKQFQTAINLARNLITRSHQASTSPQPIDDSLDQLEKLARLRSRGIINEQEYKAKKKQLLGL